VALRTLSDQRPTRHRHWVRTKRLVVHESTAGRVGYVHIPDMGAAGYAEFHRDYLTEATREGLIVDVRFNRGGHVSQLILEKLARRLMGFKVSRHGTASTYPAHTMLGPMVCLTNEMAGSDGDIFSHAWKLLDLGPLIGKRTWGGVVGIWPRHWMADGSITTQPEFSSWFPDVKWNVENYGTEPTIEVDITPEDEAMGKDPQLDKALAVIEKMLHGNLIPDFGQTPNLDPKK
jgi:tricorn protease